MARAVQKIKMIKISDILPNPYQIRRVFDRKSLMELSESIKENGVIVPVILRASVKGYEIICGQRRVRASLIAGLTEIPSVIIGMGDLECAQISLLENMQRENLTTTEEAEGIFNLMSYHRVKKEALLKKLSIDSIYLNDKIKMLSLSEKVRYKAEECNMPEKFMRELLRIHDEKRQLALIKRFKEEDLTYYKLCEEVRKENNLMIKGEKPSESKNSPHRMSVYKNTVMKAVEMLKNYCANVETEENENENVYEIKLRIYK